MLTCREVTTLASDFLDGDLSLFRRMSVRFHLARCSGCAEFLAGLRVADQQADRLRQSMAGPEPELLDRLKSSVSAGLSEEKTRSVGPRSDLEASNEPLIEGIDEPSDERVRRIFEDIRQKEGFVPNLFRAYAHQPDVLEYNWQREKSLMYGGILGEAFKSAIVVVVSADNGCGYCVHHHQVALQSAGFSQEEFTALLSDPESSRFTGREKALLALVRQANRDPHKPADALLARVRAEGATDAEIIEAMSVMELYSSWNKFLDVMRIPLETDVS
ncbi:peroxidase-related enzyme [Marinobacter alkaliphilus]|uniref:Peroxidase-related enzyme n=1 Tax=Marinobacter alkaliphilus TaxID=254719 RepID=A0ABZ3E379_9GAMM